MLGAALCAPDHGGLLPWRVIEFPPETRNDLAALFAAEKLRRDPVACPEDVQRAREHATHAPVVLAFVVRTQRHPLVPVLEQSLSAGAALGSILSAAHLMGFGAIILSGDRCQDEVLRTALRISADEALGGFISIGTIAEAPPGVTRPTPERVWSSWIPTPLAPTNPEPRSIAIASGTSRKV